VVQTAKIDEKRRHGVRRVLRAARDASGLKPLDARFAHVMTAALCEFLFSAKPVFISLFGQQADTVAFRRRYCDFVTDLLIGADPAP